MGTYGLSWAAFTHFLWRGYQLSKSS